jgi:ribosomal protein S18 acetylase RimI-like enzyme
VNLLPLTPAHAERVRRFIAEQWGADFVVAHGEIYYPHELPGFAAFDDDALVGLVSYALQAEACEIVTLDSLRPRQGLGSALLRAAVEAARAAGCRRVWLITTNDNLNALRFYQKRGFRLRALHRNALARSRQLKPTISLLGQDGIPLRDELELELWLPASGAGPA